MRVLESEVDCYLEGSISRGPNLDPRTLLLLQGLRKQVRLDLLQHKLRCGSFPRQLLDQYPCTVSETETLNPSLLLDTSYILREVTGMTP